MNRRDFIKYAGTTIAVTNIDLVSETNITRSIPTSGEKLPVIGMGTWRTFNTNQPEELNIRKKIVSHLADSGNKLIDSSPMYGRSEALIGDITGTLQNRSEFFLASKVWTTGQQQGKSQIRDTFRFMKTEKMDLMQVHNLVDVDTQLRTLKEMNSQGKIRYIGITHYLYGAYDEMIRIIKKEKPDFVQCNYNILSREAEQKLIPTAFDAGCAIIINRPFEEGHLFDFVKGKKLPEIVRAMGIHTWAAFFLKFIISNPKVCFTIPATSRPDHVLENIAAGKGYLPTESERKIMVSIFEKL
jgi:diketogulonate reductase-like aldo/keto reductase